MRLVYLSTGWAAGIVLAGSYRLPSVFWVVVLAVCFTLLVLLRDKEKWLWPLLGLLAIAPGAIRYSVVPQTSTIAQYNDLGGATIEGIVDELPDVRDGRILLVVQTESISHASYEGSIDGKVLVNAPRLVAVKYGDRVRVTGLLVTPGESDTFSYSDYLARQGVFSLMQNTAVEVISSGHGWPLYSALYDFKSRAQSIINTALPDPLAALLSGILLGDDNGIPPDLGDDFSAVGASHIIAISGFNMTLISGMIMGFLGRITTRRLLSTFIGVGFIAVYTLMVGANAAVLRAALMSFMLVAAPYFKRRTFVPASLGFVLILLSAFDPNVLWDISFQLSFLATLGLSLFVDPLARKFDTFLEWLLPYRVARVVAGFLNEPLIVSVAAQITTLPLIILYFQRLSLVSIPVNILIIPVQSYLLIVGGLATVIALVSPAFAVIFFWVDGLFLGWSIFIVRLFARLPFADIELYINSKLIGIYFVVLLGGAFMSAVRPPWFTTVAGKIRQQLVLSMAIVGVVVLVLLMIALVQSRPDGYLHVWFLDVGHSNAVLIQTPDGAQMLVDGGRYPSRLLTHIGDKLPFHDREIEIVVLTHPDEFDSSALVSVLDRYKAGAVLHNGQPNLSETYAALQTAWASSEVVIVKAGYTVTVSDDVLLEVLSPQGIPQLSDSMNDNAIVLRLSYGELSFLLTSDASAEAQSNMLSDGRWPIASVMQLPGHAGTKSVDEVFVSAVQPQVIVLQSDVTNRRGDPDPDVLAMFDDAPLFRTDEAGTIHMWTDGQTLWAIEEDGGT